MKILFLNNVHNKKIILLQGVNGRKLIEKTLKKKGIYVSTVECYRRIFKSFDVTIEEKKWRAYKINTLIATSAEIMYRLYHIFSKNNHWLFKCKILVVENRLAEVAKKLGWTDVIISNYANNKYLLQFINRIRLMK